MSQHIPMTAPKSVNSYEGKERLETIQLLPEGPAVAILVNAIDIGTHETNFKDDKTGLNKVQRKIHLTFEFNGYKQYFYVGDTEMLPTTINKDYTFSIARYEKTKNCTKLLEIIEQMIGRKLNTQAEWDAFDVSSLLGMPFVCQITQNSWNDKTSGVLKYGNDISSFAPYNPNIYNFPAEHFQRTANLVAFSIDAHGFNSPVVDLIPGWIKGKIRKSHEFTEYAAKGGKLYGDEAPTGSTPAPQQFANSFAQGANQAMAQAPAFAQNGFQQANQTPPAPAFAPAPAPAPAVPTRKWLNETYTYEQMIANGWNDQQLIDNGYMVMEVPAPALPPAPTQLPPLPANIPAPFAQNANAAPIIPAQAFQQAPQGQFQQAPAVQNNFAPAAASNDSPPDDLPF